MMQRALRWLNLCGREAVQHKLKNGLKKQKRHFLAVSDLMSDSLMAIWVEPNQCPSLHSIPLTQEPIHKYSQKNIENWRFWKITFFWVGHFDFFFASYLWKSVTNYVLEWMGLNVYDYDGPTPNINTGSVCVLHKRVRVEL